MSQLFYNITDTEPEMTIDLLGGKGYNLSIMAKQGINVPPAFVIPTVMCLSYMQFPVDTMMSVAHDIIPKIKDHFIQQFGYMPLVSVRSGAKVSMPGMMDTILNVGLDETTLAEWSERIGKDCAEDSFGRLIEMYGNVVNNIPRHDFEGKPFDNRLHQYQFSTNQKFPNADAQLEGAIEAVFKSWNNERAEAYRNLHHLPHDMGTAVVIQAMVFGNFNDESCTGVLFTRNPSTGKNEVVGEYLVNAQGEDVVAGIRTPNSLDSMETWNKEVAKELLTTAHTLENHYQDMQDIEFTVQSGQLYILQTRNGKRTAESALRVAKDLYEENIISKQEVLNRISMKQLLAFNHPKIDPTYQQEPDIIGIPASNGIATGIAVLTSADAINCTEPCILVTMETTPDDIKGMHKAKGILTRTGGATSHAAVIARGMDKVCVVGCTNLPPIEKGTKITIEGETGRVWINKDVPVINNTSTVYKDFLLGIVKELYPVMKIITGITENLGDNGFLLPMHILEGTATDQDLLDIALLSQSPVIIDLTPAHELHQDEEDTAIENMFGIQYNFDSVEERVKYLISKTTKNTIYVKGKFTLVQIKKLKTSGFKVIPKVENLEQLLLTNGLCEFTPKDISDDVMNKVLSLKSIAKETLTTFSVEGKLTDKNPESLKNKMVAMTSLSLLQSVLRN